MRLGFFAMGIILLLAGLLVISYAREPVTVVKQDFVQIAEGEVNSFEITDVPLNKSDRFKVVYQGGRHGNPDEIDVMVFNPDGTNATFTYSMAGPVGPGLLANQTGSYKIQLLGVFFNPSSPFLLLVREVVEYTETQYPNTSLQPVGLIALTAGTAFFVYGAISTKKKTARAKLKAKTRKASG